MKYGYIINPTQIVIGFLADLKIIIYTVGLATNLDKMPLLADVFFHRLNGYLKRITNN